MPPAPACDPRMGMWGHGAPPNTGGGGGLQTYVHPQLPAASSPAGPVQFPLHSSAARTMVDISGALTLGRAPSQAFSGAISFGRNLRREGQ